MNLRPFVLLSIAGLLPLLSSCGDNASEAGPAPTAEQVQPAPPEFEGSLGQVDPGGQDVGEGVVEREDVIDGLPVDRQYWTGDLDGMVERRVIRALVVYSKTFYFYDKGQPRGISCEALEAFEEHVNKALKLGRIKVSVAFLPVNRDELIEGLVKGYGDIAVANLTITPGRQQLADFSDPVLTGVKELVVSGANSPQLATLDDLSGKEVYVRQSSSYYQSLVRLNARLTGQGKVPVRIRLADENLEDEDILEMVNAGLAPLTVIDDSKANLWKKIFAGIRVHDSLVLNEGGAIGWAVRKNSPKLRELVNSFVKTHRVGTSFGNTLLRRYTSNSKWVRAATASSEMKKFKATVELFQKYAKEYEFDWLIVMAQAYQESHLDHRARSRVGAVGIMQVMPASAAGPPVSIREVTRLEDNIHAGVKLLHYYRNQYFSQPEIDELNRALLSFAAYNAGPNRIQRLRERTAKQGLDPNQWFRNVELVVAKSVGREPVEYVGNVFKYYLAYKLVQEREGLQ